MLPLLANKIHLSLSSASVTLIYCDWLTKRQIKKQQKAISQQTQDLNGLVSSLEELLSELNAPKNIYLNITLASDLVRYITLPAQSNLMSRADQLAYAKAAFREVYGQVVSDWRIQAHDAPPNKSIVAVAVDEALLSALEALAKKYHLKLASIQPYLMRAYNRLRGQIGQQNGLLSIMEHNRVLLVQLDKGSCTQVRNYPISAHWQEELNAMLAREALLGDYHQHQLLLYAPMQKYASITLNPP